MTVGRREDSTLVARLAQLRDGDVVVVDIGCGPGDAARWAARHGAARVVAVDPADMMRRLGRMLVEIQRVVQPGGRFVVIEKRIEPGGRGLASHGWTDDMAARFAASCTEHGFVDARHERHGAGRRGDALAVLATAPERGSAGVPRANLSR